MKSRNQSAGSKGATTTLKVLYWQTEESKQRLVNAERPCVVQSFSHVQNYACIIIKVQLRYHGTMGFVLLLCTSDGGMLRRHYAVFDSYM